MKGKTLVLLCLSVTAGFLLLLFLSPLWQWKRLEDGVRVRTEYRVTQEQLFTGADADILTRDPGLLAGETIPLNTATAAELERLPRIGPVLAQAIVDYRAEHGPFAEMDELTNVSGIGDSTLDEIRDYLRLED